MLGANPEFLAMVAERDEWNLITAALTMDTN